jgi:hypothetical protein
MVVLFEIEKVVLTLYVFHADILLLVTGSILGLVHRKTRLIVPLISVLQLQINIIFFIVRHFLNIYLC